MKEINLTPSYITSEVFAEQIASLSRRSCVGRFCQAWRLFPYLLLTTRMTHTQTTLGSM